MNAYEEPRYNGSDKQSELDHLSNDGSDIQSYNSNEDTAQHCDATHPNAIDVSEYGYSNRALNDIVDSLRRFRVSPDFDFPQIAVIGKQSAGKSSLIEGISGITMPRGSQTCTRCPIEVRLRTSAVRGWICKVYLDFNVDPGNLPQEERYKFFASTSDRGEVQDILHRAQLALVKRRPGLVPDLELERNNEQGFKIQKESPGSAHENFSRNIIVVEVEGSGSDLTFIDLPGLISNETKILGSKKLILDLVESYVKKPQCIILVTVDASDNEENQSALEIAQHHDKAGLRTIRVLTKPDMVGEGDEEPLLQQLEEPERGYGYYVVKRPATKHLQLTPEIAQQKEDEFFRKNIPWCKVNERRRGVKRVADVLSTLLMQRIRERIPEIRRKITGLISKKQKDLDAEPQSIENPLEVMTNLFNEFFELISAYTTGTETRPKLQITLKRLYTSMLKDLEKTRLSFDITKKGETTAHIPRDTFWEDTPIDPRDIPAALSLKDLKEMIFSHQISGIPSDLPPVIDRTLAQLFLCRWEDIVLGVFEQIQTHLCYCVIASSRELFGDYPQLDTATIKYAGNYLTSTAELVRPQLKRFCEINRDRPATQNLGVFKNSRRRIFEELLHKRHGEVFASSATLHPTHPVSIAQTASARTGQNQPAILSSSALAPQTSPSPLTWKAPAPAPSSQLFFPSTPQKATPGLDASASFSGPDFSEANIVKALATKGYEFKDFQEVAAILRRDEYEDELRVIATNQAIFEIALNRTVDEVSIKIQHDFLEEFAKVLRYNLMDNLGLKGHDGAEKFMEYTKNPELAKRRTELEMDLRFLHEASTKINKLRT